MRPRPTYAELEQKVRALEAGLALHPRQTGPDTPEGEIAATRPEPTEPGGAEHERIHELLHIQRDLAMDLGQSPNCPRP